jgi:ribosome-associated toxin RatA of RatAB toxin-antitoxin module
MQSTVGIDIEAPPRLVFELARDVERWPDLLPHYRAVRLLERHDDGSVTARMLAVRPLVPAVGYGIPVAWRARVWTDVTAPGLRFRHQGGATDGMDVSWRIERTASGSRVSIEHVFAPRLGGWGFVVDRLFVRPIATRTLRAFKAIAEAANAAGSVGRSGDAPVTKGTA